MTQQKVRRSARRKRNLDGEKLRRARVAAGLEQKPLAQLVGTDPAEISRYETGKADPNPKRLKQLADAVGKTPEDLMPDAA
jgi:transcriptional regulator with XRE-family HTH domain